MARAKSLRSRRSPAWTASPSRCRIFLYLNGAPSTKPGRYEEPSEPRESGLSLPTAWQLQVREYDPRFLNRKRKFEEIATRDLALANNCYVRYPDCVSRLRRGCSRYLRRRVPARSTPRSGAPYQGPFGDCAESSRARA